jgi:hypothetical protein
MAQHHNYSLTELDNMLPWERQIYVSLLQQHIKEENERISKQNQSKRTYA